MEDLPEHEESLAESGRKRKREPRPENEPPAAAGAPPRESTADRPEPTAAYISPLPIGLNAWRSLDRDVINCYRLAELYKGPAWTCLTGESGEVESESFLQIDNPAVRVVSLRTLGHNDSVEIRLLNVLLTHQSAELYVKIPHAEAKMTTADGRILELLEKVDEVRSQTPPGKVQPIGLAKARAKKSGHAEIEDGDMLGLIQSARYRIELGANALISIRLEPSLQAVEKDQRKRKGGS